MKNISKLFVMLLLLGCASCSSDDAGTSENGSLTCSPTEIDTPAAGGTYTVSVVSSREWTAYTNDNSWITVNVTGSTDRQGTVTIAVTKNDQSSSRTGVVTIKSGTVSKVVQIRQAAPMQVSKSEIHAPSAGDTYMVTVSAASAWTATASASWIHPGKSDERTLSIVIDANEATVSRSGSIVIATADESVTISVTQESVEDRNITVPSGYELVWHDEFDEGTSPNTAEWWYETGNGGWGNHELQNYVTGNNHPEVCSVADGFLSITARKSGSEVQSIRVNTSRSWQYGWFEARLKLPSGKGTWPAFWMMPKNFTSWPGDGEIDIMEEVGYDPNRVYSTVHCTAYNGSAGTQKGGSTYVSTAQTDFHVYALEWTPQYIRGMVDGQEYFRYTETGSHQTWPFDAPFYLKLNLAWGGDWGGAQGIDESALPATYMIDYVRVFQKK